MKKSLICIVLLVSISKLYAQEYPILTTHSIWQVVYQNGPINPNSQLVYVIPILQSDTILNGTQYKKIFYQDAIYNVTLGTYDPLSAPLYFGCLRNDVAGKKVYYIPTGASIERLIYNFDAIIGDTLFNIYNVLENDSCDFYVSFKDAISLCGKEINHLVLNRINQTGLGFDVSWYEGWGGEHGILTTASDANLFCCFNLICFNSNDTVYNPVACYQGQCQLPTGLLNLQFNNIKLEIFPDPTKDYITVTYQLQGKNATLQIFNMLGELVVKYELEKNSSKKMIAVGCLVNGVYTVRLTCDSGGVTKRFVKE